MMGAMARCRAGLALGVALVLAGCTSQSPPPPEPSQSSQQVALRVTTAPGGARQLTSAERTDLEAAIGEVLGEYVASAFLGDFPRERFLDSFGGFTSGAAELAAQDLEVLTAARVGAATSVQPTALDAQLFLGVDDGEVFGATAFVDFTFDATMSDATTQQVTLGGRLMLVEQDGSWAVFAFDVRGDDGAPVGEGES
jgi:hypothetical protein